MQRREFLKTASVAAGLALTRPDLMSSASSQAGSAGPGAHEGQEWRGDMIYRPLGKTGVKVSAIGLGGAHIGANMSAQQSIKLMRSAVDRGITFFDNCWDYHDGESERRMGMALRDGYRQKVFLMSKIDGRTRESAAKQIDESLQRLQTDHVDLMQFHEIIRMSDPGHVFQSGGALEAMLAAKKAGKVRFIGFTGHKDPSIHLHMLETARKHDFHFDTVQMPLNPMDAHFRSFEHEVLPIALKDGVGILGMKSMGDGILLQSKTVKATECLHYAMSLPTSVVITGIDKPQVLDQALEAAKTFRPLSKEQVAELLGRTREAAANGKYELFKSSTHFDGTGHHPEWLGLGNAA